MRWFLMVLCSIVVLSPALAQSPPATVLALQEHIRKLIDTTEPSIVALVISQNPNYPPVAAEEKARGILGDYTPRINGFRGLGAERDRLDLSDQKNITLHQFATGIIIDETGLILTNYHAIENATRVFVRMSNGKGCYADIHAADARADLAVLKMRENQRNLQPVRFGEVRLIDESPQRKASVYRGQWIVALGHPFAAGIADGTASASWGMISNLRRRALGHGIEDQRTGFLYQYGCLLQTDARLNIGSSGGGLFNLDGELIGLSTSLGAIAGSEASGGYALPITPNFRRIIERLREGREVEYGFLGVAPSGMSSNTRRPGLTIGTVTAFTPAGLGGLQNYDVIESINGQPVREIDDLFYHVGTSLAGSVIQLRVHREASGPRDIKVTLAKFLHPQKGIISQRPEPIHGLRVEYSSILLQQNLGGRGIQSLQQQGVIVRELEPGSTAEAKFKALKADPSLWLITSVNGKPVTKPDEFYRAAADNRGVIRLTMMNPNNPNDSGQEITLP
ncbi:MAG: trypsin-like peptidase domain-containing protein [Gemmataceae bacterium]